MSARSSVKTAVIMILEERERDKGNLMASGYTSRWEWQWIPCAPHPRQLSLMRVCILQTVLDPYKGANHLPLFAAVANVSFIIVCNRSKAEPKDLPKNVDVVTVPGRTGTVTTSTFFGRSFGSALLRLQTMMKETFATAAKSGK